MRCLQIDYILVKQRYRNSVKNAAAAYPGADWNSDHNLVMIKVKLRLKRVCWGKKVKKWNREELKSNCKEQFAEDMDQYLETEPWSPGQNPVQSRWERLKSASLKSGEENIGYGASKKPKKPWVTDQIIEKIEERRKRKNENTQHDKWMYKKN